MVLNETITEGHARALLGIKDPESIVAAADIVVNRKLSVRQTEELVRKVIFGKNPRYRTFQDETPDLVRYARMITDTLGYNTRIRKLAKGGRVIIKYESKQQLEELLKKLGIDKPNEF